MADIGVLRIQTPDGQVREHPVDFTSAIVGKADGNQIVIPHYSVARRHARLTVEGGQLMVEDLSSNTGTAVNGRPLAAGERALVSPGAKLQFGECEATFRMAAAPVVPPVIVPPVNVPPVDRGGGPRVVAPPPPPPESDAQRQWLRVTIVSPTTPVQPGASSSATVAIQNRGTVVDEVSLAVADVPAAWVEITRARLSLLPGAREEVTIVIRPPDGPEATAGPHQLTVVVQSRQHQMEVRSVGEFTVLPIEAIEASMHPLRAKRDFTLTLVNKGNATAPVAIEVLDDEAILEYELPAVPPLAPGDSRRITLKVKRKSGKRFGKEVATPFHVIARLTGSKQAPSRIDGTLTYRPPLQVWKRPVLALLVLAGLGGGAYGIANNCSRDTGVCANIKDGFGGGKADGDGDPTPTAIATAATTAATQATAAATTAAPSAAPTTAATSTTPATPSVTATTPPPTTAVPTKTPIPTLVPDTAATARFTGSVYKSEMGELKLDCPGGFILTGIRIGVAVAPPYVSFVEGECRVLSIPSANRLAIVTSGPTVPTSNTTPESFNGGAVATSSACDPGWAVTGFGGRTGNLFDALKPICTQFSENGSTAGTTKDAKQVGGAGGSEFRPVFCPTGDVATGMVVDKDPTGLFLFALTCAKAIIVTPR